MKLCVDFLLSAFFVFPTTFKVVLAKGKIHYPIGPQCPVKWSWSSWSACDPEACTRYRRRRCELPATCAKEVCMHPSFARQRSISRRYRPCVLKDRIRYCKKKQKVRRHWGSTPFVSFAPGSRLSAFRKPSSIWKKLTPVYLQSLPAWPMTLRSGSRRHRPRRPFNNKRWFRRGNLKFKGFKTLTTTTTTTPPPTATTTTKNATRKVNNNVNKNNLFPMSFSAFFGKWSAWSVCELVSDNAASRRPLICAQIRTRICTIPSICGDYVLLHRRRCRLSLCRRAVPSIVFEPESAKSATLQHIPQLPAVIPSKLEPTKTSKPTPPSLSVPGGSDSKYQKCGISELFSYHRVPRIIGGRTVPRGKWPWMVVLFNRRGEQFCGGALIAAQWVLTAAHCLDRVSVIRVGEHALEKYDPGEITLRPSAIFAHPNYNPEDFDSDLGLILLDRPLNFSKFVISACLPLPEHERSPKPLGTPHEVGGGLRVGTMCTVVGWGKLAEHFSTGSSRPREVRVPIVSRKLCSRAYADQLTRTQFCAGYLAGGRDSCGGDSGGPLMCQQPITITDRTLDANGQPRVTSRITFRWVVEGLVSHGDGCGLQQKFGVYTRVDAFTEWINVIISRPDAFLGRK